MRSVWWLLLVAACSNAAPPGPDASVAMAYQLSLVPMEPHDRPVPAMSPVAYIDGMAISVLQLEYPDQASAIGSTHRAELRYGEVVVAALTVTIEPNGGCSSPENVTHYNEFLCAYASGDLRRLGVNADNCFGDSFCSPSCSCQPDEHCTAVVASLSPFSSHMGCVPVGVKLLGDACTFSADASGTHDDCADGFVCVAGNCHQVCGSDPNPCATCGYVEGYPPELRVCL